MRPETTEGLVLRRDVPGAPLKVGTAVRIVTALDESADDRFAGRQGVVCGYVYDCPREQFPQRPLLLVQVGALGEELFFVDELRAATVSSASRRIRRAA